jgi:preprotein translocase subunit SecB
MSEENAQTAGDKQFAIQKIYVKDTSFETPNSPEIFTQQWEPEVNLNLNTGAKPIADNTYETVLTLTVTCKVGDKTAYLCEIQQAGIFTMAGFSEEEIKPMLGAFCPNTLYPYAREAVSDLVSRGGFPQLVLAPVNFDALFAQQIQNVDAQVDPAAAGGQPQH